MFNNKKISLVIPCYNEEKGIENILSAKPWFIDEVIVVDNGSTDNTAEVARRRGAIIVHERIRGYGRALQSGFSKASGDIIISLDGDNTYPVQETQKLISCMKDKRYDFVVGYRYPLINKKAQFAVNRAANYFISFLVKVFFKIPLSDSQSGMMAFEKSILDKIKSGNTGMGFSQEIKINAFLNRDLRCGEVHIPYSSRIGKVKFRMKDAIGNLYSVIRLYLQLKFKKT